MNKDLSDCVCDDIDIYIRWDTDRRRTIVMSCTCGSEEIPIGTAKIGTVKIKESRP